MNEKELENALKLNEATTGEILEMKEQRTIARWYAKNNQRIYELLCAAHRFGLHVVYQEGGISRAIGHAPENAKGMCFFLPDGWEPPTITPDDLPNEIVHVLSPGWLVAYKDHTPVVQSLIRYGARRGWIYALGSPSGAKWLEDGNQFVGGLYFQLKRQKKWRPAKFPDDCGKVCRVRDDEGEDWETINPADVDTGAAGLYLYSDDLPLTLCGYDPQTAWPWKAGGTGWDQCEVEDE